MNKNINKTLAESKIELLDTHTQRFRQTMELLVKEDMSPKATELLERILDLWAEEYDMHKHDIEHMQVLNDHIDILKTLREIDH